MGSCFSKKGGRRSSPAAVNRPEILRSEPEAVVKRKPVEETVVKKEVFIIKHRRSHEVQEKEKKVEEEAPATELDAILIQCGRLSRNSSTSKAAVSVENLGSSRSYDFDKEPLKSEGKPKKTAAVGDGDNEDAVAEERDNRRRDRRSQSQARRRTPSREREKDQSIRSGSRERGSSGGERRRVSRSPGRRSQSPVSTAARSNSNANSNSNSNSSAFAINAKSSKPGKMVSVPATVPNPSTAAVKTTRITASPRTRSPARANQPPPSLSRSNSKKTTENSSSPFRRTLTEIDTNIISQSNEEQLKITRTRSSRLSRDLEDQDTTKISSYTALLLEDIQNFHQKSAPPPSGFSLPPCVTKACSILEAVADLNSSIGSNLSSTLMEDQRREKPLRKSVENSEIGEPIFESVIVESDDLMAPSFQKYVSVKRGGEESGKEESSGSNSVAVGVSSVNWEPNSAESNGRCLSSSSVCKQSGIQGGRRAFGSSKKGDFVVVHRQKGKIGGRGSCSTPVAAAAAVASS